MEKYRPKMYKRSIFDINYDKLKKKKIRCLLFDLDNTLLLIGEKSCNMKVFDLFQKLKKSFDIYIVSNNGKRKRLQKIAQELEVEGISFAMKPTSFGFAKIRKKYGYRKEEMCMIGDQIMTDILGGNRFGIETILVEPLGIKDLKITSFNRFLEKKKIKKLEELGLFKKGEFYE